jgi:hypothetical protein
VQLDRLRLPLVVRGQPGERFIESHHVDAIAVTLLELLDE